MLRKILIGLAIVIGVLLVAYIVLSILADPAEDHPYFTDGPPRPWVIAHQGGDGLWPGDTLYAFENAAELGVDVLEMDLHQTGDGVLVIMHDETVDRTTDGTGLIKEMTLAELKDLDAGYDWSSDDGAIHPFRGQGITAPTLEEVFSAFPDYRMVIEIKQSEPSITAAFCQQIRDAGMQENVLVGSFHQDAIDEFRENCPEVATSAGESEVITFFVLSKLFIENILSPTALAMQVPEEQSGLTVMTQRFVNASHNRNMEVQPWTIDEVEDQQRMLDLGADGIITDHPDRLMNLLGRAP